MMNKAKPVFTVEKDGIISKIYTQADGLEIAQLNGKNNDVVYLDNFTIKLLQLFVDRCQYE